jgi:hypothetical protein
MKDSMSDVIDVSVRGEPVRTRAISLCGVNVLFHGRFIKTARVFDEYWLERDTLPAPETVIGVLREMANKPDIFVFAQRVPDTATRYAYHHIFDNYAVLPLSTYEHWFQHQIPAATKRNIRASEKRGILTRVCDYDNEYVRGISSIYNETPIRAGRRFWHFGKDIELVRKENGTYAARSTYLAAYYRDEMVGYLKVVWDKRTAAIMQILSKTSVRDRRVNNALLAEAVKHCCTRGVEHLLYERFDYGKKIGDSLTRFKQNNGFLRMDIPRYYVPLTLKGSIALRLGLHKNLKDRLPEWMVARLRDLRTRWYKEQAVQSP